MEGVLSFFFFFFLNYIDEVCVRVARQYVMLAKLTLKINFQIHVSSTCFFSKLFLIFIET